MKSFCSLLLENIAYNFWIVCKIDELSLIATQTMEKTIVQKYSDRVNIFEKFIVHMFLRIPKNSLKLSLRNNIFIIYVG